MTCVFTEMGCSNGFLISTRWFLLARCLDGSKVLGLPFMYNAYYTFTTDIITFGKCVKNGWRLLITPDTGDNSIGGWWVWNK